MARANSSAPVKQNVAVTEITRPFTGSYRPEDVTFLLKHIELQPVDLATKERLIQSGQRHYSEMLSRETLPDPSYLALFQTALAANGDRLARDLCQLAAIIAARRAGEITLLSLARAGTPIGVILKHLLSEQFGRRVAHYSVSIVRDRGLDRNALRHVISAGHRPESVVFVDGWTGKGVISAELAQSVAGFNAETGLAVDPSLFVVTDLAGTAVAASDQDYLIPSSILNATVSGLISRTVLNAAIGPGDFHGCTVYAEWAAADLSRAYVDDVLARARRQLATAPRPTGEAVDANRARARAATVVDELCARYRLGQRNLLKPGIGEATRVLLRRVPQRLVVRDPDAADVAHLIALAKEKSVPYDIDPNLPFQAIALIKDLSDA